MLIASKFMELNKFLEKSFVGFNISYSFFLSSILIHNLTSQISIMLKIQKDRWTESL